MGYNHAYLKRGLPLAALVFAAVFSIPARGAETRAGSQPILFSSPANDDDAATNMPSLSPKPPGALDLESIAQAPESFGLTVPAGPALPMGQGPVYSGDNSRSDDLRRNWTLLTPAEILGAATPEKIMGISERNAFGQPKNSTALERYTERQNQLQLRLAKTNSLLAGDMSSTWNFSGNSYEMSNSSSSWRNQESMGNALFDSTSDRQTPGRHNENNAWSRLFDQSMPMPASGLTSQSDMERFRQLLNPGAMSITPAAGASSDGIKTTLPQTMLSSSLAQSSPSRMGTPFTSLSSGISKPPELPKLPAAWMSYTSSPPAATWSPQQAPWLAPGPQLSVPPQRKF